MTASTCSKPKVDENAEKRRLDEALEEGLKRPFPVPTPSTSPSRLPQGRSARPPQRQAVAAAARCGRDCGSEADNNIFFTCALCRSMGFGGGNDSIIFFEVILASDSAITPMHARLVGVLDFSLWWLGGSVSWGYMSRKYFGTDGIRGRANGLITPELALKVGQAAGLVFQRGDHRHRVVIGKDTRLSGYMIEYAMVAGFTSVGMDVLLLGPMPTPAVAMLTKSMRADLGVMISASHNLFEDNGIKLFGPQGFKLSGRRREADRATARRVDRPPPGAEREPRPRPPHRRCA